MLDLILSTKAAENLKHLPLDNLRQFVTLDWQKRPNCTIEGICNAMEFTLAAHLQKKVEIDAAEIYDWIKESYELGKNGGMSPKNAVTRIGVYQSHFDGISYVCEGKVGKVHFKAVKIPKNKALIGRLLKLRYPMSIAFYTTEHEVQHRGRTVKKTNWMIAAESGELKVGRRDQVVSAHQVCMCGQRDGKAVLWNSRGEGHGVYGDGSCLVDMEEVLKTPYDIFLVFIK